MNGHQCYPFKPPNFGICRACVMRLTHDSMGIRVPFRVLGSEGFLCLSLPANLREMLPRCVYGRPGPTS